jgi:hypothetical protein
MPVSHYFNNYSGTETQEMRLLEDMVVESITIMGHDVYYLPRESYNADDMIFGENPQSKFEKAYVIEAYLANVEGFEGDGDFFSKFGLEIRDTSNFVISRRSFDKYVPSAIAIRPREGDLIFVPVLQKIFEIKFVEEELMFFSLGKRSPYIYELRCEVFRYSNENISTGVDEVDVLENDLSYTICLDVISGNNDYYIGESVYQGTNLTYSNASAIVKTWSASNSKIYLINTKGAFIGNTTLIGETSNTRYTVTTVDLIGDHGTYDLYDNKDLQDGANSIISTLETNIFGSP